MTLTISKRQVEGMTRNPHRKHSPQGQPYTRVQRILSPHVESTPEGPKTYAVEEQQVWGYTFEQKFDTEIEDWITAVEEHDLGKHATLQIAHEVAREWRSGLVGEYALT